MDSQGMTAPEVVARISRIASADLGDFIDTDGAGGARINLDKAKNNGKMGLVKKIKFREDGGVESLELYSAAEALDALARIHSLFNDRLTVQHEATPEIASLRSAMASMLADPLKMQAAQALRRQLLGNGQVIDVESRSVESTPPLAYQGRRGIHDPHRSGQGR